MQLFNSQVKNTAEIVSICAEIVSIYEVRLLLKLNQKLQTVEEAHDLLHPWGCPSGVFFLLEG